MRDRRIPTPVMLGIGKAAMLPTTCITALMLALFLLLIACEQPTPTPTPPPSPTPTPEPTAVERLAWLDARPDTAHWIAWNALRRMAIDNEPLTQQIASLGWVVDGITAEEAGALDDVSWLLRENPAIADTALSLPWITTNGVITPDDRRALRAIRAAASTDENLGATLAGYEWLADGLTQDEAAALETLGEFVAPGFTTQTATGIGAIRLDRSGIGTPPSVSPRQLQLATSFSQFPWMQDDVTSLEIAFIANLNDLVETAGSIHEDAADMVISYDWVQDGIEPDEPRSLLLYESLFQAAGVEDADILPIMLEYEWIADGLRSNEVSSTGRLTSLLNASSPNDANVIRTMVSYPWLSDAIDGSEFVLLSEFPNLLRLEEPAGAGHRRTVLDYDWLADDITPEEIAAFRLTSNFIGLLSAERPDTLDSLLTYEWLRDDIREDEVLSIRALGRIVQQLPAGNDDFIVAVIARPWLQDDVQERENWLLEIYASYLAGDHYPDPTVKEGPAPQAPDGSRASLEVWDVGPVWGLLRQLPPSSLETTTTIIERSVFQDASMIAIGASLSQFSQVIDVSDSVYGVDLTGDLTGESGLVFLLALLDAQIRSRHQFQDLLEQHRIAQRTLNLPLAGDVELYVVRHTEFPDDDPTLNLMEQIMVQLEDFMGVPFPRNPLVILIMEPSARGGEEPRFGVAYAISTYIVASPPRHNPGFHLAIFHEVSHMYWGGHTGAPPWWTEGAAGFLPDIARDALGHESLSVRRSNLLEDTKRECWDRGVPDISAYYKLQQMDPNRAADRGICVYAFGELFLVEMYLLLGHDATSAAMRQLYVNARYSGWFDRITNQQIYDAFRANTPDDKVEEFRKLFLRLHGGARVNLSESAT